MADIEVRILNAGVSGDQINSVEFNKETNNVSKTVGSKTTKNDGQNLISWGNVVKDSDGNVVSKVVNGEVVTTGLLSLADGYVGGADATLGEQSGYNGFVFGVVPESKEYSVQFTLTGENIDSVTFYGDKNANQFPTRAYLNGDTSNYIYSDDPEWKIVFPSSSSSHTVTFDRWNRANYNACITHIVEFTNEVLDKRWIKSVESLSQSTGQPKEIYYGVTPSSGSIDIIDINGEFYDMVNDGIIPNSNVSVEIIANGKSVQYHKIIDSEYSNDSVFNVKLGNQLSNWDSLQYSGRRLTEATDLYSILVEVLGTAGYNSSNTQSIDSMLDSWIVYGENTNIPLKRYLQSIIIPYPYLESGTMRQTIDKICTLAQLNVLEDNNGKVRFVSARPKKIGSNNILKINPSVFYSSPNKEVILKNKYSKIQYNIKTPIYDFIDAGNVNINFFTRPDATVVDDKLYYKNNYSSFETDYKYSASSYDNISLISDKIVADYTDSYYALYKVTPPDNIISKDGANFKVNFNTSCSYRVVQYPYDSNSYENFYFSEFKRLSNLVDSYSFYCTRQQFDSAFYTNTENEKAVVSDLIIRDDSGQVVKAYVFVSFDKPINCYTVIEEDGHYSYYMLVKTHHKPMAYIFTSSSGLVMEDYSINLMFRTLRFSDNENSYGDGMAVLNLSGSELFQNEALIGNLLYSIVSDYKDGLYTANLSIACTDIYNINGQKERDWSKGEMIQVDDVLRIDKDVFGNSLWNYSNGTSILWRVTGRNFRKSGVPMIDLELQEVKYDNYYLHQDNYVEGQAFELSDGDGTLGIIYYKTMAFDVDNGTVSFSDVAVLSDLVSGAKVYWASEASGVDTFDEIVFTSTPSGDVLECTANVTTYSVQKSYS